LQVMVDWAISLIVNILYLVTNCDIYKNICHFVYVTLYKAIHHTWSAQIVRVGEVKVSFQHRDIRVTHEAGD